MKYFCERLTTIIIKIPDNGMTMIEINVKIGLIVNIIIKTPTTVVTDVIT